IGEILAFRALRNRLKRSVRCNLLGLRRSDASEERYAAVSCRACLAEAGNGSNREERVKRFIYQRLVTRGSPGLVLRRTQPKRVGEVDGISVPEAVQVEPAGEANRILLREPSAIRVVIPVPLVLIARC